MNGKFLKVCALGVCVCAFSTGCKQTPQDKAEAIIEAYLQENLNDPASYESVSMGKLERVSTEEYAWRACQREAAAHGLPADTVFGMMKQFNEMHAGENIKGDTLFWELQHTYRAKNAYGAVMKHTYVFKFDKHLENIVATDIK